MKMDGRLPKQWPLLLLSLLMLDSSITQANEPLPLGLDIGLQGGTLLMMPGLRDFTTAEVPATTKPGGMGGVLAALTLGEEHRIELGAQFAKATFDFTQGGVAHSHSENLSLLSAGYQNVWRFLAVGFGGTWAWRSGGATSPDDGEIMQEGSLQDSYFSFYGGLRANLPIGDRLVAFVDGKYLVSLADLHSSLTTAVAPKALALTAGITYRFDLSGKEDKPQEQGARATSATESSSAAPAQPEAQPQPETKRAAPPARTAPAAQAPPSGGWDGNWIANLSRRDCKGIAAKDVSWCESRDCKGIAAKDVSWCENRECKGVASGDLTWCTTSLCKAWASKDLGWCGDRDCKGVASGDLTWCNSAQCKAIASGDLTWCP